MRNASTYIRPRYIPQAGQAACGNFGALQFGHVTVAIGVVFHCERRERVLLRDIFLLGTATIFSFLYFSLFGYSTRLRHLMTIAILG